MGATALANNAMEAVPLHELGEHLRDQRWLDMRVDDPRGVLVKRVRFTSIIVRPTDELVSCRQEWVEGTDDTTAFKHQNLAFDCDAIWKVGPTLFDVEHLRPYGVENYTPPPETRRAGTARLTDSDRIVLQEILTALANATGRTEDEIGSYAARSDSQTTGARYDAMLLLYDMTQLSMEAVYKCFGYASPTPLHCARSEINVPPGSPRHDHAAQRTMRLRRLAKEVIDPAVARRGFVSARRQPASSRWVLLV